MCLQTERRECVSEKEAIGGLNHLPRDYWRSYNLGGEDTHLSPESALQNTFQDLKKIFSPIKLFLVQIFPEKK